MHRVNGEVGSLFREFKLRLFTPVRLIVWIFLSLTIGFSGPFGSYESLTFLVRLAYWGGVVGVAIILMTAIKVLLSRHYPRLSFWYNAVIACFVFALIYSLIIHFSTRALFLSSEVYLLPIWKLFLMTLGISISVHGIVYSLSDPDSRGQPRLMQRLPEAMQAPILRLSVRDHHVDVFTEKGVCELRLRFADAVAEMEGIDGLCVHRSHWVAVAAVTGSEKVSGRVFLTLKDGSRIPVSRKYRDNVVKRGLI